MLADTLTGSVAYTKVAADTESGSLYVYTGGLGGVSQPYRILIKHDGPSGSKKGTIRHLISSSRPITDSSGEGVLVGGERVTVNLTISHPNVAISAAYIQAQVLDMLVAISNATTRDAFLDSVLDGSF